MRASRLSPLPGGISFSFATLALLLGVLWLAGGASRADALGQVVVRASAWLALIAAILVGNRPEFGRAKYPTLFLSLAIVLVLIQLAPLPPSVWQALPGRSVLTYAASVSGQPQPWRPLAIVPSATLNAAASLVVPLAMLVLLTGLQERERLWLPGFVLALIAAAMVLGLLQFSGAGFNSALLNDVPGQVSSIFANRNHFALFLSMGCLLAPVWAFLGGRRPGWRGPAALGLVLVFVLAILATGSRTGIAVGGIAVALALVLTRHGIRRELRGAPRWVFPVVVVAIIALFATFVTISVLADRAKSFDRLVTIDAAGDTRVRALPTVVAIIRDYAPAGTGFGSFDPVFRISEPYAMLKPTYLNHAHNDILEVVLNGGLAAAALLLAALAWWTWASFRAWRGSGPERTLARTGSAILLLVVIASVFDYPGRTPLIMAMIVIAGIWLSDDEQTRGSGALPKSG